MGSQIAATIRRLAQLVAWPLLIAVGVLSVTPPTLRPILAAHTLEHFAAFLVTGITVGLGYPYRWRVHALALLAYIGAVELAQLVAPGRHARLSDFAVNAISAGLGMIVAYFVARITKPENSPDPRA